MKVNNNLISTAIFLGVTCHKVNMKQDSPSDIHFESLSTALRVSVLNTELYINLSSTQTSLHQKAQYKRHFKETPLCHQYI